MGCAPNVKMKSINHFNSRGVKERDMGNLKLNILNLADLKAKKLDDNDPKIKKMLASVIEQQKKTLSLKHVSAESLRMEITI